MKHDPMRQADIEPTTFQFGQSPPMRGQEPRLVTPAGRQPSGDGGGAECMEGQEARVVLGAIATVGSGTGVIRAKTS